MSSFCSVILFLSSKLTFFQWFLLSVQDQRCILQCCRAPAPSNTSVSFQVIDFSNDVTWSEEGIGYLQRESALEILLHTGDASVPCYKFI